jgi:hypothetical protein
MCLGAAVQSTITRLHFAGRDPYGGAARMVVDTPQAQRRPLGLTGPLPDQRGRFAELIHVRWLLDFGAAGPALDTQRLGIPDVYQVAGQPAISTLFGQLRADRAGAGEAMAATAALLPA